MIREGLLALVVAATWAVAPAAAQTAPTGPLPTAAERGDLARVEALLAAGADANTAAPDGMTALHWAAEAGDARMVEALLTHGARTDVLTRLGGFQPIHLAARSGNQYAVAHLLTAGADPNARTEVAGASALHYAAAGGNAEVVSALVAAGAEVDAREREWGQTPLMFAAAMDRLAAAHVLLDAGADVSATAWVLDIQEREITDRAARRGDAVAPAVPIPAADRVRLGPGADRVVEGDPVGDAPPEGQSGSYSANVGAMGGLTPLLLAVREGHAETAFALLERGASLEEASAGDGTRPLLMATINGHFDLAMALLGLGADPNSTSAAGATPLYTTLNTHWIPKTRHPQPTDYLQQETSYLGLMGALLKAGADPNARLATELWYTTYTNDLLGVDRTGATAFWRAAHATDVQAMRLLVAHGADPSIGTRGRGTGAGPEYGVLPIHAASGVGHGQGYAGNAHRHVPDGWLPSVRYLVEEHGADVNALDLNGYTPVHHAAARGDNELILYLVERGADVTVVSRRGQTTADMANGPVQRLSPYISTVALLEKLGATNNHNCVGC